MDWNALVPILLTTAITVMTLVGRAWKHQSDMRLAKLKEDREEDRRLAAERRQEVAEMFAYQEKVLERLEARNRTLSDQVESLIKAHADDYNEIERLRSENTRQREQLNTLQGENEALQSKMRHIESENATLKAQVEKLSRQLKEVTGGGGSASRRRRN